jgi:hypothetical protein
MAKNTFALWQNTMVFPGGDWSKQPVVHTTDSSMLGLSATALLRQLPMLELQQTPKHSGVEITPMSAVQVYNNCRFNDQGKIVAISPALARWTALCWMAPITDLSRAFKGRRVDAKYWRSEKCVYRMDKSRIRPRLSLSAQWKCRSAVHSNIDTVIDAAYSKMVKYDICKPCVQKLYKDPPSYWYQSIVMGHVMTEKYYNECWKPILALQMQAVLRGAAMADRENFWISASHNYLDALVELARIVQHSPVAFAILGITDDVAHQRRQWGQVLGMETHSVLSIAFSRSSGLVGGIETFCNVALASHGITRVMKDAAKFRTTEQLVCHKVREYNSSAFLVYKEKNQRYVLTQALIKSLYFLCDSVRVSIKLTGFACSGSSSSTATICNHPRDLPSLAKTTQHLVVYQCEYLQWHELHWMGTALPALESVVLAGNYGSARYGVWTPCPRVTLGACFTILVNLAHTVLGFVQCEPIDKDYQNASTYPTDKQYEEKELTVYGTADWPPPSWEPSAERYLFLRAHENGVPDLHVLCPKLLKGLASVK